ncbi:hypothetical protein BJ912DRAFT_851043, partial [Pholiota molesta]
EAHLCPVRALSRWIELSRFSTGYVFRKIAAGDRPSSNEEASLTSEQFLEMFRNNLLDVKLDPIPYGTHSFRRGGCQHLATDWRWPIRDVCEWGGWSTEFSSMTIVKYLISLNDDPRHKREDFLNPNLRPVVKCFSCGRTCGCS